MKRYNLPTINKQTDAVILANGLFPSHAIPLSILNNSHYLVCCDGAVNNITRTSKQPDAIVGDCDSLSVENQSRYAHIIHRVGDQETNDLTKAVNFCVAQGKTKITILGASGKREDHTMANISLLCEYMKICDVEMITDYGIFVAITEDSVFESQKGEQVSLFGIDQCPITSHQLVYPIVDKVFTSLWQATLNEAMDNEFRIETVGRVIVYRAFE